MNKKVAFSLLELSISITIISLIAGVILASANLYNQSKLRSVIKEIQALNNAVNIFKDRFGYLPGDFPSTPISWNAINGNGDGSVQGVESKNAMHHLYQAQLINQPFNSIASGGTATQNNFYKSQYSLAFLEIGYVQAFDRTVANDISFGAIDNGSGVNIYADWGVLKPKEAYYIDSKIDDGVASRGLLFGLNGVDAASSGGNACSGDFSFSGTVAGKPLDYNFASNLKACRLYYWGSPLFNG